MVFYVPKNTTVSNGFFVMFHKGKSIVGKRIRLVLIVTHTYTMERQGTLLVHSVGPNNPAILFTGGPYDN